MDNKLSNINRKQTIKIVDNLDKIVALGFQIEKKFQGRSLHIETSVYASYFQRFICCYESVSMCIKKFNNGIYHFEYPISILLRASLLDCLTLIYLRSYYEEIPTELNNTKPNYNTELGKLLSSQIRRILTPSKADRNSNQFNLDSFKNTIDVTVEKFGYLFNDSKNIDYNKPSRSLIYGKHSDEITNPIIRKRLDHKYNYSDHYHPHIFYLYDIFSKHDHFGMMSMLLSKMDINEVFENFSWSLYYIRDGIVLSLEFLRREENFEQEYHEFKRLCRNLGGIIRCMQNNSN